MFKNLVIALLLGIIALATVNNLTSRVEKVEGLAQVKCVQYQCYEIGNSVYLIKN